MKMARLNKISSVILSRRRRIQLESQLSDLLIWLSSSLKSGLSLPQAFQLAAEEIPEPLGRELKLIVARMEQGMILEESLLVSERRLKIADFSLWVHSIVLLRQVGGNFVAHFETLAQVFRQRTQVSGKVRLMAAQGLMQGNLLALMPLGLCAGLYFLSPDFLQPLFTSPQGWMIVALILFLGLGGWLWMRQLARVKI